MSNPEVETKVLQILGNGDATTADLVRATPDHPLDVPGAVGSLLKRKKIHVCRHFISRAIDASGKINNGDRVPVFALTLNSKAEEGNW